MGASRLFVVIVSFAMAFTPVVAGAEGPLRALAQARGIFIGAAVAVTPFQTDSAYTATLKREFDMLVAENAFKWDAIHPSPKRYAFSVPDALVAFALQNGMAVRGHTLVWHHALPSWLVAAKPSRNEAIALLRDHIQNVVGHFKGKIEAWDVVNEAIDDAGKLRMDSFWYQTIGADYVAMAFRFAHEADPVAKLYYNDFQAEDTNRKSDGVYALVKRLLSEHVPIAGVGWQMHIQNGTSIGPGYVANARRLAELGLEISVTELDVAIQGEAGAQALATQAATYGSVVTFCLQQPNCKAVVSWGFTDRYSWIPTVKPGWGSGLPFDGDYAPKPAYSAIVAALASM